MLLSLMTTVTLRFPKSLALVSFSVCLETYKRSAKVYFSFISLLFIIYLLKNGNLRYDTLITVNVRYDCGLRPVNCILIKAGSNQTESALFSYFWCSVTLSVTCLSILHEYKIRD